MKLILHAVPATIAGRLQRMGVPYTAWSAGSEAGASPNGASSGSVVCLSACPAELHLAPDTLLVDLSPTPTPSDAPLRVTVVFQDSGFAVEHGFLLAAGGPADLVERAVPLLDTLAPTPGAWLYAGGQEAPYFMQQVLAEFGGSWQVFAARMMAYHHSHGLSLIWQEQQALAERLQTLAQRYIDTANERDYRPFRRLPLFPAISFPGMQPNASPASNLAHYLCWFTRQRAE